MSNLQSYTISDGFENENVAFGWEFNEYVEIFQNLSFADSGSRFLRVPSGGVATANINFPEINYINLTVRVMNKSDNALFRVKSAGTSYFIEYKLPVTDNNYVTRAYSVPIGIAGLYQLQFVNNSPTNQRPVECHIDNIEISVNPVQSHSPSPFVLTEGFETQPSRFNWDLNEFAEIFHSGNFADAGEYFLRVPSGGRATTNLDLPASSYTLLEFKVKNTGTNTQIRIRPAGSEISIDSHVAKYSEYKNLAYSIPTQVAGRYRIDFVNNDSTNARPTEFHIDSIKVTIT